MRDAIFPLPAEELSAIDRAAAAFRVQWTRIKNPPWAADFDFTRKDVETIDYMQYEGLKFPECGTDGAVLIVAEVVRRACQIQWYMSYRGEWILADKDNFGGFAVAPRARFHEYECGRGTQFGRYLDLLSELALECVSAEHGNGLLALFPQGGEYFDRVQEKLDRIRRRTGSK